MLVETCLLYCLLEESPTTDRTTTSLNRTTKSVSNMVQLFVRDSAADGYTLIQRPSFLGKQLRIQLWVAQ